jgi:hypothetical protein
MFTIPVKNVLRRELYLSLGRLSHPDYYTTALGKLRQAEVVTGDPKFQKLKGEITTTWDVN